MPNPMVKLDLWRRQEPPEPAKSKRMSMPKTRSGNSSRPLVPSSGGHRLVRVLDPSITFIKPWEVPYFDNFRLNVVPQLRYGRVEFWRRTVLRESVHDEGIRNALLALGALGRVHEQRNLSKDSANGTTAVPLYKSRVEILTNAGSGRVALNHYYQALVHHSKAINAFRRLLASPLNKHTPRSILIATVLLVEFESLQGNTEAADQLTARSLSLLYGKILHGTLGTNETGRNGHETSSLIAAALDDEGVAEVETNLVLKTCLNAAFSALYPKSQEVLLTLSIRSLLQLPMPPDPDASQATFSLHWTRCLALVCLWYFRTHISMLVAQEQGDGHSTFDTGHFATEHRHEQLALKHGLEAWQAAMRERLAQYDSGATTPIMKTESEEYVADCNIAIAIYGSYYSVCTVFDVSGKSWDDYESATHELLDQCERCINMTAGIRGFSNSRSASQDAMRDQGVIHEGAMPIVTQIANVSRHPGLRHRAMELWGRMINSDTHWDVVGTYLGSKAVVNLEEQHRDPENGDIPLEKHFADVSMEALAALSLACNVLQLVGTGLRATAALQRIRDEHKPDASLKTNATVLRQLSYEVGQSVKAHKSGPDPSDDRLLSRARDIICVSQELEQMLERFSSGKKSRVWNTFRYVLKKDEIQGLEKRLQETQQALQTTILVEMQQTVKKEWAVISTELPCLKVELQALTTGLHSGNTDPASLVSLMERSLQQTLMAISDSAAAATKAATEVRDKLDEHGKEATRMYHDEKEKAATQRLLDSLYFASMNERRNMSSLDSFPGTFEWVFDSKCRRRKNPWHDENKCAMCAATDTLRSWLVSGEQSVFWISGHAGTGKSTLVNYLIRQIADNGGSLPGGSEDAQHLVLSAFIWSSGDEMQKSVKGLLCTLLHQTLSHLHDLGQRPPSSKPSWPSKKSHADWNETEIRSALSATLHELNGTTYVFVDGLDEIQPGRADDLLGLLSTLQELGRIKICVSSRPEPIFERSLQRFPHLRLQDLTHNDIFSYLERKLGDDLRSLPGSDDMNHNPDAVIQHLTYHASGVFLWVELVVRSLKEGITNYDTWEQLWARIKDIPEDLESLYGSMLRRRGANKTPYHNSSATFFALILAHGNLELNSLAFIALYSDRALRHAHQDIRLHHKTAEALYQGVDRVREQMRAQCGGLLDLGRGGVDPWSTALLGVSFIHRTARDFMLDKGRDLWQHAQLDWAVCIEAKHALYSLTYNIRPVELWAEPGFHDMDMELLGWCACYGVEETWGYDCRDKILDFLAQEMVRKSYWDRDRRNPAVLATFSNVQLPGHWIDKWAPTGMSRNKFLNQLLLCASEVEYQKHRVQIGLELLRSGADPHWRDKDSARGTNWPTAFTLMITNFATHTYDANADLVAEVLEQHGLGPAEEITVLWGMVPNVKSEFGDYQLVLAGPFNRGKGLAPIQCSPNRPRAAGVSWCLLSRMTTAVYLHLAMYGRLPDKRLSAEFEARQPLFRKSLESDGSDGDRSTHILGCVEFSGSRETKVGLIDHGVKLDVRLALGQAFPCRASVRQDLAELWKRIDPLAAAARKMPGKMNRCDTMDWLAACGFPEDTRDEWWENQWRLLNV
ncbi:uncharacterized protein B0I36DRAFT_366796 [Microdochium trichocladiopsis]|uniref:Nephrocystin 3-like N-terminal domain-containing protein n=1 Tax=Microdochium trichocladiopsis TaxID=1682393 RepID=A0A9P9BLH5_9PEZI|nr:uncharacterized protein B0I36DRAFT_366796 [Microdochium trichocladiopsis]KAH7024894.1 hypothetical protein B0I36DRAFT_366796 [Microdochium trichocladiopsis]